MDGPQRRTPEKRLARKRDYPIIRFLVFGLHALGILCLLLSLLAAGYLWLRAEAQRDGYVLGGPLADALSPYSSQELLLGAAAVAGQGLAAFLIFGAVGQFLAMQRDRTINSANQVRLLEDILELNEEVGLATKTKRVELCEGCGRLGSLHRIESGQWVCRECRRQLRSTA
ncbi:MAG TPA: hypothetical protein PL151_14225 [Phycisphaerae bacterium]|nr:hypothetical protein [Phycisphaerae bacterium]HOJ75315.1 hypothetical protein [Phycisphaerae bacterium]HOM53020.1 hypothetical protein [Phycisphaerae bacterium]HON68854.1 hypothetical protein [Phycisphaerae bacterium]HOQ87201.1 hypothetical protein [Phycisphaerae bacterium]